MTFQIAIALILGSFAAYTIATDGQENWSTVLLIVSVIMAASSSYQISKPDIIQIDEAGILWKSVRKNWCRSWSEISHFTPVYMRGQTFVGYVLATEKPTVLEQFAKGSFGAHGMFENGWEISADELYALLSDAREYWLAHPGSTANPAI